jgi:hypothetical protein
VTPVRSVLSVPVWDTNALPPDVATSATPLPGNPVVLPTDKSPELGDDHEAMFARVAPLEPDATVVLTAGDSSANAPAGSNHPLLQAAYSDSMQLHSPSCAVDGPIAYSTRSIRNLACLLPPPAELLQPCQPVPVFGGLKGGTVTRSGPANE